MKKYIATSAAIVLALGLASCTAVESKSSPPAKDSAPSTEPSFAEPPVADEPDAPTGPLLATFGEAITYENNVSISISAPVEYVPTEYAAGATLPNNIAFTITLTNGSDTALDPYAFGTMVSGGQAGSHIFDSGGPMELGMGPNSTLLPGNTFSWTEAWSVVDWQDLQYETSPGFEYEDAIFTY